MLNDPALGGPVSSDEEFGLKGESDVSRRGEAHCLNLGGDGDTVFVWDWFAG